LAGADAKTDDDTAHELVDTRRYVHEVWRSVGNPTITVKKSMDAGARV
jgi:hypothetical protein